MSNIIVHTNPSLYDKSVTLKEAFTLHPRRNSNVLVVESGLENEVTDFLTEINNNNKSHMLYLASDLETMTSLLESQLIGTQLYIVATWDTAKLIFEAAVDAGFTEDEIQTKVIGDKKRYVYCMKCFQLNDTTPKDKEIQCSTCSAMLAVGPFYSKFRKGNIGYPFKPVTQ